MNAYKVLEQYLVHTMSSINERLSLHPLCLYFGFQFSDFSSLMCMCAQLLQSCELQPTRLLCPWDSPSTLEWVAMPSSRGSSLPRDRAHVSCIEGRFFNAEPLGKLTSQGVTHVFILPVSPVYYFHQQINMVQYVPFILKKTYNQAIAPFLYSTKHNFLKFSINSLSPLSFSPKFASVRHHFLLGLW